MRRSRALRAIAPAFMGMAAVGAFPTGTSAETMTSALLYAYRNNPQLNAQRAQARITDENVPQALSGYRPRLSVTGSVGETFADQTSKSVVGSPNRVIPNGPARIDTIYTGVSGTTTPWSFGATGTQTVFNGFQTGNRVRTAEGQVSAAREALRVMEESVLLAAATSYMDVLRDSAIVEVQRSNVRVLQETLKQTRDRFNVGEVTRTDVAQAEAQLASGKTQELTDESNLTTTRSNFRRIIGNEPSNLAPGSPVDRFLPGTLPGAVELSLVEN